MNPAQFAQLHTIRLDLNDDRPDPWTEAHWQNFMYPMLLNGRSSLRSLSLQRFRHVGCYMRHDAPVCPVASLDLTLQLPYPQLERIELVGAFAISMETIVAFLARHPKLQEFHMPVSAGEDREVHGTWREDKWWRAFYKALRMHPALRVRGVRHRFMEDSFSAFRDSDEPQVYPPKHAPLWCHDLNRYLNEEGGWTEALEEKYGKTMQQC